MVGTRLRACAANTACQSNDCRRAGSTIPETHSHLFRRPTVERVDTRQRPVSWLAVVSRSAFPDLRGKSSASVGSQMTAYSCGGSCGIGGLPVPHSRFTFLEGTDDNCQKAQCSPKFKPHFTSNRRVSCFEFGAQPSKSIICPWNSGADRSRPWPSLYERQRRIIPFLTDIVMSGIKGRAAEIPHFGAGEGKHEQRSINCAAFR